MDEHGPLAPDDVDRLLAALLRANPGCAVTALRPEGFSVPLPDSVAVEGHPELRTRIVTDVVAEEDRTLVVSAWDEAFVEGSATTPVRLIDGNPARFHFIDARPRHGVLLALLVSEGDIASLRQAHETVIIRPRVANLLRDEHAKIIDADRAASLMLGWPRSELVGRRSLDLCHLEDHPRAIDAWIAAISDRGVTHRVRCRYLRGDGSWLWVEVSNTVVPEEGEIEYVETELVDVSEEMAAHEALRTRERLLRRLTEALPSGVVQIDAVGTIVHKNERADQLTGTRSSTTLEEQLAWCHPEDMPRLSEAASRLLADGRDADLELRVQNPDQVATRICQLALRALTDDTGQVSGGIVSISDVTESSVLRDELVIRATYDALTGCYNRAAIMSQLERTLAGRAAGEGLAVVFVDLDRFKAVNDRFGHAAGDRVLRLAADRLKDATRSNDFVGRMGGDEFLVVCPTLPSVHHARNVARRIADRLAGPVVLDGVAVDVGFSVGVAWAADPTIDAGALVARADAAMYVSKREGVGRPVVVQLTETGAQPAPAGSTLDIRSSRLPSSSRISPVGRKPARS
jgi:diguanylate cyclase (GGDEF)-like protein/PAS domain S-box-containing protein